MTYAETLRARAPSAGSLQRAGLELRWSADGSLERRGEEGEWRAVPIATVQLSQAEPPPARGLQRLLRRNASARLLCVELRASRERIPLVCEVSSGAEALEALGELAEMAPEPDAHRAPLAEVEGLLCALLHADVQIARSGAPDAPDSDLRDHIEALRSNKARRKTKDPFERLEMLSSGLVHAMTPSVVASFFLGAFIKDWSEGALTIFIILLGLLGLTWFGGTHVAKRLLLSPEGLPESTRVRIVTVATVLGTMLIAFTGLEFARSETPLALLWAGGLLFALHCSMLQSAFNNPRAILRTLGWGLYISALWASPIVLTPVPESLPLRLGLSAAIGFASTIFGAYLAEVYAD